jgi:hypothetical protein
MDSGGNEITWEMIHYDVQLIGGVVLHQGKIAEMATGEGKTLVATLPVFLNALTGRGVHVVTVTITWLNVTRNGWGQSMSFMVCRLIALTSMNPTQLAAAKPTRLILPLVPTTNLVLITCAIIWPLVLPIWCNASIITPLSMRSIRY